MGIPDGSLLDLIDKVRSWITSDSSDSLFLPSSKRFETMPIVSKMCHDCGTKLDGGLFNGYSCLGCSRLWCKSCYLESDSEERQEDCKKLCRECHGEVRELKGNSYDKVHPRDSPDPSSLAQSENLASSLEIRDCRNIASIRCYPSRGEEEEGRNCGKQFLSPSSEYNQDSSDIESGSVSARHEIFSCKSSAGSSPHDSPLRNNFSPLGRYVQHAKDLSPKVASFDHHQEQLMAGDLAKPDQGGTEPGDHEAQSQEEEEEEETFQQPLDFENNGRIWYPPPPEDENDDAESNYFTYDDEDDDIGDSAPEFSLSSSFSSHIPTREKLGESNNEPLRTVVHDHFRALVAELLRGEELSPCDDGSDGDWLDTVTALAWQAANFVKPDTRAGGSMDPGNYVKIKCVASGTQNESILIRGIVCSKNITHKRMTSQYKNPRVLLLAGSLEYQRVAGQLASFNTLLQQENDHLKAIIAKIDSLRPNVLLVEKSVSSYAQQYLLEKDISLVLNVKRSLLDQIARCTGAVLCPSVDCISTARLGHCELFRTEKVLEQHEAGNQSNKKPSRTLMYFEGCPRRLGCTVVLRGSCREELKKIKHVIQYAVFAAYHLSLETSFLADEGASLPRIKLKQPGMVRSTSERRMIDDGISLVTHSPTEKDGQALTDDTAAYEDENSTLIAEHGVCESLSEEFDPSQLFPSSSDMISCEVDTEQSDALNEDLPDNLVMKSYPSNQVNDLHEPTMCLSRELPETSAQLPRGEEENQLVNIQDLPQHERFDEDDVSSEYFSAADSHQSILVSFSSRCVLKESVCERSRLLRIKFYGSFDKPLGKYLKDDLFDQTSSCRTCKELVDAHVLCYSHQNGNLTINVRRLKSMKLPGEQEGKIWMWHRCLRCAHVDGVPPATRRVVMSDAAWGLSFGKFLELSFSNHATANRVASCGHSLQRDCLRFYGFGNMVAFFRYSPINILTVFLPPSMLEFNSHRQQEWIRTEAAELMGKMQTMYAEISGMLNRMEEKSSLLEPEQSEASDLQSRIMGLRDQLVKEKDEYDDALEPIFVENLQTQGSLDILELNRLRRALMIGSHAWDHQLYLLNSQLKKMPVIKTGDDNVFRIPEVQDPPKIDCRRQEGPDEREGKAHSFAEANDDNKDLEIMLSPGSSLSERIDSAWLGSFQTLEKAETIANAEGFQAANSPLRRLARPIRVQSFDSAIRFHERIQKGLPPSSLYFSTVKSFHASGKYRNMVRDPVSNVMRTYSQMLPLEVQKLDLIVGSAPTYLSSASQMADGARMLIPQRGINDIVIPVYDDDPASVVSYALNSKEYKEWVANRGITSTSSGSNWNNRESEPSTFSTWRSLGAMDVDYIHHAVYGSSQEDKKSPHLSISFSDRSSSSSAATDGKVKFSVTCYFATQFDTLRKACCPSEVDFVRSLSRCQRWCAQGGKSNVYFAKSLDERFIIKQVVKTELDSFEDFASEYFKYMKESLSSGSPTCLAKILGIYQVSIKHSKGGKETKMDLMVMENLFYNRKISRIYDLKGSARSRYNPNTSGTDKVLLDMNLLETLRTEPIFLGSKAKRSLERAIWNDTNFLASVDVMDYSLLVGFDEERKELVLGIIDFMRQYTWDKHLETWVKASGILGGPKNASPTIISPKQYKRRFRKAMTTYFLTVPEPWTS